MPRQPRNRSVLPYDAGRQMIETRKRAARPHKYRAPTQFIFGTELRMAFRGSGERM